MSTREYHNEQSGTCVSREDTDSLSLVLVDKKDISPRNKEYIEILQKRNITATTTLGYWDTLPHNWQKLFIEAFGLPQQCIRLSLFEMHYIRDTQAIKFYTKYQLPDGKLLPDKVIDEYSLNSSVLNTLERICIKIFTLNKHHCIRISEIWLFVANECNRFRDIQSHTLPANAASLRRKLKDFKNEGYLALIHRNFCNKSAQKIDDAVIKLLNAMFAKQPHKPTATEIARQYEGFLNGSVDVINNETAEIYQPSEFPKLSQTTITNYLAKWINKVGTHTLRSGDRQMWIQKFKPYHSMKMPEFAGSIVSVDDRQPPFWYEKGKRVWMYGAIDLGSAAITCWIFGKTKESLILEFYRQMVRNYTEWGLNLPYELEGEMSGNSVYLSSFLAEGRMFQKTHIEANNARGKRIESYWKPLRYGTEKKRLGWIARPNALSEPNQFGPQKNVIIPYDHIIEDCKTDIQDWNNSPHPVIENKTRWEVLLEMQHPNMTPTNWRAFLPHLGYKTQTSCNAGIIRLNNQECLIGENGTIAFSDRLIDLMAQIEGKDLDVYWIDGNDGKVLRALAYLRRTDRCVCEAISKPVYHRAKLEQSDSDIEAREQMCKYVASVNGFITSQRKSIDNVTVIDHTSKTLNDKFQIESINKTVTEQTGSVEVLPEADENEDDLNFISTPFNKGLYDRF